MELISQYFTAIIMGIVEGLTEFIPVSSTGHLILTGEILGFVGVKANNFEVVIQLGAILAVVCIYWKKLLSMINPKFLFKYDSSKLTIWHIAVAIIPIGIIGFLVNDYIDKYLFSPLTVIIGLTFGSIALILGESLNKTPKINDMDSITIKQAFFIGLSQCFALWPGFSRSGATISGGLFFGIDRKTAAEFSFIIAIPVMLGASSLKLIKTWSILNIDDLLFLGVGFVVSFIVAYAAVLTFLKILDKYKLNIFAYYRLALAFIAWIYFF